MAIYAAVFAGPVTNKVGGGDHSYSPKIIKSIVRKSPITQDRLPAWVIARFRARAGSVANLQHNGSAEKLSNITD